MSKYAPMMCRCCDICDKPQQQWPKGPEEPAFIACRECVDAGRVDQSLVDEAMMNSDARQQKDST